MTIHRPDYQSASDQAANLPLDLTHSTENGFFDRNLSGGQIGHREAVIAN